MLYKQHMHCAVEVMAVEMRWDYPRCDGLIGTGMQVATTSFPRMAHTKHIESKFPNFRHFIAYLDILVTNILYLNKYDNISIFNFPWQKMQYFHGVLKIIEANLSPAEATITFLRWPQRGPFSRTFWCSTSGTTTTLSHTWHSSGLVLIQVFFYTNLHEMTE